MRLWKKTSMPWVGSLNPLVPRGGNPRALGCECGQRVVPVPLWLAPKLALHLASATRRVNNSELARRLGVDERAIRRMIAPGDPLRRQRRGI